MNRSVTHYRRRECVRQAITHSVLPRVAAFLVPIDGEPLLESELEPIAARHSVARPAACRITHDRARDAPQARGDAAKTSYGQPWHNQL